MHDQIGLCIFTNDAIDRSIPSRISGDVRMDSNVVVVELPIVLEKPDHGSIQLANIIVVNRSSFFTPVQVCVKS
jgi:hypothetical protein